MKPRPKWMLKTEMCNEFYLKKTFFMHMPITSNLILILRKTWRHSVIWLCGHYRYYDEIDT